MAPDVLAALAHHLFAPGRVALIGASDDPAKTAARPLRYLRQAGFAGTVYPINPRRETVLDEKCWPSLDALPERPDHAFILSPTDTVVDTVEHCGRLGIPIATILASGFSEAGAQGKVREARLKNVSERTGIKLLGPSSLGIVNLRNGLLLTANAAFAEKGLPAGSILAASQSGSLIGGLMSRGKARGIGFAGLVSVGNETSLSVGEICSATLDDPEIDSYLLFLETLRHTDALRAFAIGAAERGKPVIAYKIGRSAAASELALSHTGSLAGEDDVAEAFFAACGIARVESIDGLLEAFALARRLHARAASARKPTVGIVTTTGGGAAMVVDQLAIRDVAVAPPSHETQAALDAVGIAAGSECVVDLTLAGTRYDVMKGALDIMLAASEFDCVIAVVGSSGRLQPELAVQPAIDSAGSQRPLAACLVPDAPTALGLLNAADVPGFRGPESCADAVAAILRRREPTGHAPYTGKSAEPGAMLDEVASYELLDELGIAHPPSVVLKAAEGIALPFAYPVAVKLLSDGVVHKSDLGGVELGIGDEAGLKSAIRRITASLARHRPDLEVERVLVQPMMAGLGEVLCGYRVDPQVGPIVMVAMGGIFTEIYRDRALRLAPVDVDTAREMIREVNGLQVLAGYRGKPPGDLGAVAEVIVALSQLAVRPDLNIAEAEINPLLVRGAGEGVVAIDAVVRLGATHSSWKGSGNA